jgi:hypothetical protein
VDSVEAQALCCRPSKQSYRERQADLTILMTAIPWKARSREECISYHNLLMATAEANSIRHGRASAGMRVLAAELRRRGIPNLKGRRRVMAIRERQTVGRQ